MQVLGIETTTDNMGVAVCGEEGVMAEFAIYQRRTHAEQLAPAVTNLLSSVNMTIDDVDGISICSGPGSFTGVRIGMSLAKALAYASSIPIVSVTSLEALARAAGSVCPRVCATVDAGRGRLYGAEFSVEGHDVHQRTDVLHGGVEIVAEIVSEMGPPVVVVGPGSVAGNVDAGKGNVIAGPRCLDRVSAGFVAELGRWRLTNGRATHLFSVQPVYVGKPVNK